LLSRLSKLLTVANSLETLERIVKNGRFYPHICRILDTIDPDTLKLHRQVANQLKRFPKNDQTKIASAIRNFANEPRPEGAVNLRQVLYRLRVGQYRILYAIFDNDLVVVVVQTTRRSEASYKDLNALIDRAERLLGK